MQSLLKRVEVAEIRMQKSILYSQEESGNGQQSLLTFESIRALTSIRWTKFFEEFLEDLGFENKESHPLELYYAWKRYNSNESIEYLEEVLTSLSASVNERIQTEMLTHEQFE